MQEEIIQFFAAVTMDLRRTNEIQRQKINQQEKRIRQLEKRANEFVMFRTKQSIRFGRSGKNYFDKRDWADDRGFQYTKR